LNSGRTALTGGIATGKSTVARIFAELGACILDADRVAREVVRPGTPCWQKLKDFLGSAYFDEDGNLRRRELRERIIRDNPCRCAVNAILHPCIMQKLDRQWQTLLQDHGHGQIVIFDIPLLFEADLADYFDTIVLVYTSREIQMERLIQRDGISPEEAAETLRIQFPIETKIARSHLTIDNSNGIDHTFQQVRRVWEVLVHQSSRNTST